MNALDLESVHFESSNGTDLTVGLADQAVWESAASKSASSPAPTRTKIDTATMGV